MSKGSERESIVLVLGGKPIGSCELVKYAQAKGAYVIVADYLPLSSSPAKRLADEVWNISTADVEALADLCVERGVTAVVTGVHEFNIQKASELCEIVGLPFYCSGDQLRLSLDKEYFKKQCRRSGLPVAKEYREDEALRMAGASYPLAVKPLDGSGSRGFSKCEGPEDLRSALSKARRFSESGQVLIEEYVDADAVIIHYTAVQGEIIYSGIADKHSLAMGLDGAPIMALQIAPSLYEDDYLYNYDERMRMLLREAGVREGPIWIEAFRKDGTFIFNELGYRFGGSLTYHLVKKLYGIDQLRLLFLNACGVDEPCPPMSREDDLLYVIWPVHLLAGTIAAVDGLDAVHNDPAVNELVFVHGEGDIIENWGSAQQVFAYVHFALRDIEELLPAMRRVLNALSVRDGEGGEMLFALFDPSVLETGRGLPCFLEQRLK